MDYKFLIDHLISLGYLKTPLIIEAFRKINRKDFVLPEYKKLAYEDTALPIGFGQTISQPLTVAFMLEELQPKKGEIILDVGAGSGWQTVMLAYCVGEEGKVIAIERIPGLADMAKKNIAKYNFIEKGIVEIRLADGSRRIAGIEFDKIIAAAAGEEIPEAWKEELKIGGRIVAPVENGIVVMEKISEDEFKAKKYPGFVFVPLVRE